MGNKIKVLKLIKHENKNCFNDNEEKIILSCLINETFILQID